jgi:hypothetical protein
VFQVLSSSTCTNRSAHNPPVSSPTPLPTVAPCSISSSLPLLAVPAPPETPINSPVSAPLRALSPICLIETFFLISSVLKGLPCATFFV